MKGKDKTAEFLKKFAGRWESKLSAEEIITKIEENKCYGYCQ